jgi:hypothetical protein
MARLAANTLTKQSRTADKGMSSGLGVGRGANNFSLLKKKRIITVRYTGTRSRAGGGSGGLL